MPYLPVVIARIADRRVVAPVVAYVLLGVVGLSLAVPPGYVSPMFPAAGLALALVLVRGSGAVGLVWSGSFLTNVALAAYHGSLDSTGLLVAAVVGVGASVQAVLGAALVRRTIGNAWQRLDHDREILVLIGVGGPVACVVSASIGVLAMTLAGIVATADFGFAWWSWWTGDALGVLIATPLSLLFLRDDDYAVERRGLLSLPIGLTLVLAFVAFLGVSDWEESRLHGQIRDRTASIADSLDGRFDALAQTLSALRRMVEVTPDLTAAQFAHYVRRTLDDEIEVSAVSLNPLITAEERAQFEADQARRLNMPGYRITERDAERRLLPARMRREHVPIALIEPAGSNAAALGFDINSDPVRADAIARARSRGGPAATAVIQLVQESQQGAAVLVMHPVFRIAEEADPKRVSGFVVAVIKVPELMAGIVGSDLNGLAIRIEDPTAEGGRSEVFRTLVQGKSMPHLAESAPLVLADRTWSLTLTPSDVYMRNHRTWAAWTVGVAGILFATVLQVLMLVSSGRSVAIARKVEEQTAELRIKSDALEEVLGEHDALIRRIPVGVFKLRLHGKGGYRFDFVSPNYCTQLGIEMDAVLADPRVALNRIHPDDRADFRRSQAVARKGLRGHAWEGRILREGRVRWIRLQSTPTVLGDGDVLWEGVQEDVTERVAAEEGQRLLITAVEQSSASIVITDRDGNIVFVNDAFVRVTGYERWEVEGRNPRILQSGNTATAVYRELWETILGGGTWQGELQNKTKSGRIYWELATISPVTDELGRVSHFIAVKEDISEKRQREAELRAAKEEAEAANLARSRFLDNMSHEVRTPMNGILGMAQLLRMPGTSESECREYAEAILASGNQLRAMLDDILRLSELESTRLELLPLRFDGPGLLDDVAKGFRASAEQRGLALSTNWEGPDVAYQADAQRLRQMLSILIDNAVRHTGEGHIAVAGTEAAREGSMAVLRFEVSDTGSGLSAEHLQQVFHAPSRMSDGRTSDANGGLDLPLVHRLARLMHGDTGAKSTPGEGATFWFRIRAQVVEIASNVSEHNHVMDRGEPGSNALSVSVDIGDLRRRFGGDRDLVQIAIEAFLTDLPGLTRALDAAYAAGNGDLIRAQAIALGGAARAVSALKLVEVCESIAESADEGGTRLQTAHAILAGAVARTVEALVGLRTDPQA